MRAIVLVAVAVLVITPSTLAKDPDEPSPSPRMAVVTLPGEPTTYSPAEQRLLAGKLLRADNTVSSVTEGVEVICPEAPILDDGASTEASLCYGFLSTYARDQDTWFYCGPATVQVVSNKQWGIYSSNDNTNKYTQQKISDTWTYTDTNGLTSPYREEVGLNGSTSGHKPAGFVYLRYQVTSGSDWHNKVVTDVSDWGMPLTASVAPHDPGASYFLSSWPNPTSTGAAHWIVIRGWYGLWDGSMTPYVYYNDSSRDEGGATGAFSDPSFRVYQTLIKVNPNHEGKWIVW
jgi:hypothetical protein